MKEPSKVSTSESERARCVAVTRINEELTRQKAEPVTHQQSTGPVSVLRCVACNNEHTYDQPCPNLTH